MFDTAFILRVAKMDKTNKRRFSISRWVLLACSIVTNAFLILYSCLPAKITSDWNSLVTNAFAKIVNTFTEKEIKTIPIKQLNISLSDNQFNGISGYKEYEIPLGSSKELVTSYLPLYATDKAVSYYSDDNSIVVLNQNDYRVSIVGMKAGSTKIHAKNQLTGLDASYDITVVSTVAPTSYEISASKTNIHIGSQETISIDIDGGILGHNELLNSRYYDTRKLTYVSSNTSVATINNYGVITPKEIGTSLITVSNGDYSKQLEINVVAGTIPSSFANLHIEGSNVCYGNDMLNDQGHNNYPLSIFDGDTKLDPRDFIWESSDELLVKVDRHGVMRGFRKSNVQDENGVITATSKITGQSVSFDVIVREELPTKMNHWIVNGDKTTWGAPQEFTTCVGDNLVLNTELTPNVSNKNIEFNVSNPEIIECTYQGSSLALRVIKEGNCTINISSVVNPNLKSTIRFAVLKAGSINTNDLEDVGFSIRKSIGHASLFAIAEIFTLIAIFMLLYDKKHWLSLVISLGIELVIASISETIQHFVPERFGSFTDVCINMLGVIVGAGILVTIYFIHKAKHKKKNQNG